MPGLCAARHISKLDTASVTRPATPSVFKKKSSGDANAMLANRDHGASGSSDTSAKPVRRIAIQNTARAASSRMAIDSVITVDRHPAARGTRGVLDRDSADRFGGCVAATGGAMVAIRQHSVRIATGF